jgi:hypothetical protein
LNNGGISTRRSKPHRPTSKKGVAGRTRHESGIVMVLAVEMLEFVVVVVAVGRKMAVHGV